MTKEFFTTVKKNFKFWYNLTTTWTIPAFIYEGSHWQVYKISEHKDIDCAQWQSLLLLNNLIKCHFGIREKVSSMTGKGLSVRREESILVMETRGINMQTTSLQIYWRVWEEIRMLTVIFERKAHKYCSPKCNLLKCLCSYQISGDHFQLDHDNKHTTHSDIHISEHICTDKHNKRVLHWSCPVSSTTFQSQNII